MRVRDRETVLTSRSLSFTVKTQTVLMPPNPGSLSPVLPACFHFPLSSKKPRMCTPFWFGLVESELDYCVNSMGINLSFFSLLPCPTTLHGRVVCLPDLFSFVDLPGRCGRDPYLSICSRPMSGALRFQSVFYEFGCSCCLSSALLVLILILEMMQRFWPRS